MHVLWGQLQQYNTYIAHSELCKIVSEENLMLPEENLLITHESLLWRAVLDNGVIVYVHCPLP